MPQSASSQSATNPGPQCPVELPGAAAFITKKQPMCRRNQIFFFLWGATRWATVGCEGPIPTAPGHPVTAGDLVGERGGRATVGHRTTGRERATNRGFSRLRPPQNHCFSTTKSLFYPIYHPAPALDVWAFPAPLLWFSPPNNPMLRRTQRQNPTGAPPAPGAPPPNAHCKKAVIL